MVKSLPILLVLLLSLCVSRGEGIHLFPFDDGGSASEFAAGTAEVVYTFSIINQESSPVLKKQDLPSCDAGQAAPNCEIPFSGRASLPDDAAVQPTFSGALPCSKMLYCSASDRSPPRFA
ncbi:MAG: hypothetical protein KF881_04330 [Acidobacteria bacterium]|nr:hypothetical protein [Acidobacteriota bacterium]